MLDPARLTWVERTHARPRRAHRRRSSSAPTTTPTGSGPRARSASSRSTAASRRLLAGELKVRAPLVGGTVERTLVADLQDHLRGEVAVVEAFLAR